MAVPDRARIPRGRIAEAILFIRGQRVILDEVLAELYGVPTKGLVRADRVTYRKRGTRADDRGGGGSRDAFHAGPVPLRVLGIEQAKCWRPATTASSTI